MFNFLKTIYYIKNIYTDRQQTHVFHTSNYIKKIFKTIRKIAFFNTPNIWRELAALTLLLSSFWPGEGAPHLLNYTIVYLREQKRHKWLLPLSLTGWINAVSSFSFWFFPYLLSIYCLQSSDVLWLRSKLMLLLIFSLSPPLPHSNFTRKLKCHFRFLSTSTKMPTVTYSKSFWCFLSEMFRGFLREWHFKLKRINEIEIK